MKNYIVLALIFLGSIALFSSCQKEISNETGVTQIAEGSLQDSAGNCSPDTVIGTYYTGVIPGKDTAYIQVQVNVTKVGSYTISSSLENGFQFADSGFFTTIGLNTVLLKPIGAPILPNTTTFTIMFDSSLCNFSVSVLDSTGTGIHSGGDTVGTGDPDVGNGSWQFSTDSGRTSSGTFDSAALVSNTGVGGVGLEMGGRNANGDSALVLAVVFPGNTITTGTYYTQIQGSDTHANAVFAFGPAIENADATYDALDNPGDGSNIGITITSYDQSTHVIKGTFTGKAVDEPYAPALIGIQNGSFTATVSQ